VALHGRHLRQGATKSAVRTGVKRECCGERPLLASAVLRGAAAEGEKNRKKGVKILILSRAKNHAKGSGISLAYPPAVFPRSPAARTETRRPVKDGGVREKRFSKIFPVRTAGTGKVAPAEAEAPHAALARRALDGAKCLLWGADFVLTT